MKNYEIHYHIDGVSSYYIKGVLCPEQDYVAAENKYQALKKFGECRNGDKVRIDNISLVSEEEIFVDPNTGECMNLTDIVGKMEEAKRWFD